jgi:hypothetical protein
MGSNSIGQGSFISGHPDVEEINRMLNVGNKPEEVSNWLKSKYKNKRYWASPASLQNYRKNVLNLDKAELAKRRVALQAEGKTQSANGLALHQSTTELIETKDALKSEMQMMVDNIKTVQATLLERLSLAKSGAVDDMGQPIFKRSNDEMIERYLARYESIISTYIKLSKDLVAPEAGGQTNITITTAEIQKYADAFRGVLQRVVTKFAPELLPEAFRDLEAEIAKINGQPVENKVQISVANGNSQINIVTGAQAVSQLPVDLPSVEEVDAMAAQITNENDYLPEEPVITTVIETKIDH